MKRLVRCLSYVYSIIPSQSSKTRNVATILAYNPNLMTTDHSFHHKLNHPQHTEVKCKEQDKIQISSSFHRPESKREKEERAKMEKSHKHKPMTHKVMVVMKT